MDSSISYTEDLEEAHTKWFCFYMIKLPYDAIKRAESHRP